jgi:hypothetical protein
MSANYTYKIPKDASFVTLRNQNRMLYANYIIQQNNVDGGCQIRVALENGGVADASIIPKLLEGARETTVEERDRILESESCPVPPQPTVDIGIGGSISFDFNFNTVGSQVTYPNDANLALEDGDFTIEWFQYWTDDSTNARPFSIGTYANNDIDIAVSYEGTIYVWVNGQAISVNDENPPLNSWTHIAVIGTGGTNLAFYINGTRVYNETLDEGYDFTDTTTALSIGNETTPDPEEEPPNAGAFQGQITNFRWVKGTALYTGATLTVPTQPLTAVSGTQLLLLASTEGTVFADSSSANRTPTNSGASFSTTNPF